MSSYAAAVLVQIKVYLTFVTHDWKTVEMCLVSVKPSLQGHVV